MLRCYKINFSLFIIIGITTKSFLHTRILLPNTTNIHSTNSANSFCFIFHYIEDRWPELELYVTTSGFQWPSLYSKKEKKSRYFLMQNTAKIRYFSIDKPMLVSVCTNLLKSCLFYQPFIIILILSFFIHIFGNFYLKKNPTSNIICTLCPGSSYPQEKIFASENEVYNIY